MIVKFKNNNELSYLKYFNRIGNEIELIVVLDPKEATRYTKERLRMFNYFYNKAQVKQFTVLNNGIYHPLKTNRKTKVTINAKELPRPSLQGFTRRSAWELPKLED